MRPEQLFAFVFVILGLVSLGIIIPSLVLRYKKQLLRHRERMAAIEKGADLPPEPPEPSRALPRPRIYLLRGLMWLFTGAALSICFLGIVYSVEGSVSLESRLFRAQRLRDLGATEEQIKTSLDRDNRRDGPGPAIALIGLVPMAVGAAYLVFYRSEQTSS